MLIVHIILGVISVVSGGADVLLHTKLSRAVFIVSSTSVALSGIGMVVTGAGLTRACASGITILTLIVGLRKVTSHLIENEKWRKYAEF